MVFVIALVPAIIVFLVGAITRRKGPTLTAAIIAGVLGAVTGHPAYMALDIVCVVIAYLAAAPMFKKAS